MSIVKNIYLEIFHWLTNNKELPSTEVEQKVHRMLSAILLTALLMWSYALNAVFCIDSELLTIVGLTCATLHILSPLIYKFTGSVSATTHFFIGSGFIFQTTHSFYTGGFLSNTIVWFSILPLITALILGKRALVGWALVAFLDVAMLYTFNDYSSNNITHMGEIWSQLNIAVGYIVVNLVLVFLFLHFEDKNKETLKNKNEAIVKLLRIVSHDIANPLMIILGHNKMLKNKASKGETQDLEMHIDCISRSSKMIKEILDNTRSLNIIDTGDKNLQTTLIKLNDIIENSLFVFKDKLKDKEINVEYDFESNKETMIKANQNSIKNQVFNNLFSNSIKFMEPKGQINIQVQKQKRHTNVIYQDSGIGMEPEVVANLFRSDVKTTTTGVAGEKGTGFGMPILHATLSDIGAQINVKSKPKKNEADQDHGTTFDIKFKG